MTDIWILVENSWPFILFFIGLIIVYFIIREIRLMYTRTTEAKMGLEKEKINLMREDMEQKSRPFFRVSTPLPILMTALLTPFR